MRRISFFFLSLVLFAASHIAYGQDYPFRTGEKCTYTLQYKWGIITADIANLEFNVQDGAWQGTPCFHLVTRGSTTKLVSNLVKVDYLYDSYFSTDGLMPQHFYREQTEGSYWAKNTYSWSNNGRRLNARVEKSTRGLRDTVMTDKKVIYDPISMLYVMRSSDLDNLVNNGGKLHFVTAMDRNLYDMELTYVKSEEKKSPEMGTFMTDKFCMRLVCRPGGSNLAKEETLAVAGSDDGKLAPVYFWTSTGKGRTVLFFSAPVAIGSVNGRITDFSGGKYPLTPQKK